MPPEPHFVYLTEIDVSLDNGRGINEREFVRSLRRHFASTVTCIVPQPMCPEALRDDGVLYARGHRGTALSYGLHLESSFRALVAVHRRRPIDALVVRLTVTPLIPYLAGRLLGIPVILKTLSPLQVFSDGHRSRKGHERVSRLLAPMFRSVIERARLADTVSPSFAEWVQTTFRLSSDKLKVIRNHANTDLFAPGDRAASRRRLQLDRFRRIVGYVGSLSAIRHLEDLIRAVGGMGRTDLGLVLVGEGDARPRLESLVKQEKLEAHVVFAGTVPYAAVPDYIRTFDVGIDLTLQPLRAGHRILQAAVSQKIGQYLACGVPVMVWDVPDNAFLMEAGVAVGVPVGVDGALAESLARGLRLCNPAREATARAFAETHLAADVLTAHRMALWHEAILGNGAPEGVRPRVVNPRGSAAERSASQRQRPPRPS